MEANASSHEQHLNSEENCSSENLNYSQGSAAEYQQNNNSCQVSSEQYARAQNHSQPTSSGCNSACQTLPIGPHEQNESCNPQIPRQPLLQLPNLELPKEQVNVFTGDFHVYVASSQNIDTLVNQLKQSLQIANNALIGSQETESVPLDAVHETRPIRERFGRRGLFRQANHGGVMRYLKVDELFPAAREKAIAESQRKCSNEVAKAYYVMIHGNIVGVVGIAGIGKTTFGMQNLNQANARSTECSCVLAFFVSLRDFDYSTKINVLEFLLRSTVPSWEHTPENDRALISFLSQCKTVSITLDALDEARVDNLHLEAPVMGLYEKAKPDVIFKNLMSGKLLPEAQKMLISRPGAYHSLAPSCMPHFSIKVLGLNEESKMLLFKKICCSDEEVQDLLEILKLNPLAKSLCLIPMFAKLIVPFALEQSSEVVFSIADVFLSFLEKCIRSPKFNRDPCEIFYLADLALKGMLQRKTLFSLRDMGQHGIYGSGLEAFITLRVSAHDTGVRILAGDKLYYFSHLTWQEFFAALRLLYISPLPEFEQALQRIEDDEMEMVFRCLFGLLNVTVQGKVSQLFSEQVAVCYLKKKEYMKRELTSLATAYSQDSVKDFPIPFDKLFDAESQLAWNSFRNRPDDTRLFKFCCLAYEAKDAEITRAITSSLPDMILLSRVLLPTDLSSLMYILKWTGNRVRINVGAFYEPATFIGDGLNLFLKEISATNHKIVKFHIKEAKIDRKTAWMISRLIPDLQEISLQSCDLKTETLTLVTQKLQGHPSKVAVFSVRGNEMNDDMARLVSGCIPKMERLHLQGSGVTPHHMEILSNSIAQHPINRMSVSSNNIGSLGIQHLSRCIHNIHGISLRDCGFRGRDLGSLANAIARMAQPLDLLYLGENDIGADGLDHLALCVQKVEMLEVNESNITGQDLRILSQSIARMDHRINSVTLNENQIGQDGMNLLGDCIHNIKMLWLYQSAIEGHHLRYFVRCVARMHCKIQWLDLGGNDLRSRGVILLAQCIHNVEMLEIHECDLSGRDIEEIVEAISYLRRPMKLLNLSYNPLGDHGAHLLTKCSNKIQTLDVKVCQFTPVGVRLLEEAQNPECKIVGLDNQ